MPGKKTKKKRIAAAAACVCTAGLAAVGFFRIREASRAQAAAQALKSIASAEVESRDIRTTVVGNGTLSGEDPEDTKLPKGVRIDEVLVEEGDEVEEGQVLATLDAASVRNAVADVQQQLAEIDEKLLEMTEETEEEDLKAPVGGTVESVFTEESGNAASAMEKNGALLLLRADNGGQEVRISALSGEVMRVYVAPGDRVDQGESLLRLKTVSEEPARRQLLADREALGKAMENLCALLGDDSVRAAGNGVVQKVYVEEDTLVTEPAVSGSPGNLNSVLAAAGGDSSAILSGNWGMGMKYDSPEADAGAVHLTADPDAVYFRTPSGGAPVNGTPSAELLGMDEYTDADVWVQEEEGAWGGGDIFPAAADYYDDREEDRDNAGVGTDGGSGGAGGGAGGKSGDAYDDADGENGDTYDDADGENGDAGGVTDGGSGDAGGGAGGESGNAGGGAGGESGDTYDDADGGSGNAPDAADGQNGGAGSSDVPEGGNAGDGGENGGSGNTDAQEEPDEGENGDGNAAYGNTFLHGSFLLPVRIPRSGEYPMLTEEMAQYLTGMPYEVVELAWSVSRETEFAAGNSYTAYVTLRTDTERGYYIYPDSDMIGIAAPGCTGYSWEVSDSDGDGLCETMAAEIYYTAAETQASADEVLMQLLSGYDEGTEVSSPESSADEDDVREYAGNGGNGDGGGADETAGNDRGEDGNGAGGNAGGTNALSEEQARALFRSLLEAALSSASGQTNASGRTNASGQTDEAGAENRTAFSDQDMRNLLKALGVDTSGLSDAEIASLTGLVNSAGSYMASMSELGTTVNSLLQTGRTLFSSLGIEEAVSLIGSNSLGLAALLSGAGADLESILDGSAFSAFLGEIQGSLNSLINGFSLSSLFGSGFSLGDMTGLSSLAGLSDLGSLGDVSSLISGSGLSGMGASAAASAYAKVPVFSIGAQDVMKISIEVNEMDILSVREGQAAEITLDALPGRTFSGTVSDIAREGTNSGGATKYRVVVEVPHDEDMRADMTCTVTILVAEKKDAKTIPSAAVFTEQNRSYVYTVCTEDGTLEGKQEVGTGLADGEYIEITDGLPDDAVVYYRKKSVNLIEQRMEAMGEMNGL